jgi:hypothetical protein
MATDAPETMAMATTSRRRWMNDGDADDKIRAEGLITPATSGTIRRHLRL